jgi:hypothetical protein
MQSTSCGKECPFVKSKMCKSCKECPNFIETWWIPEDGAQPVKLEDCAPKRLVLQQQLLQARFDLTTQALVQSRNEYNQLCSYLKTLVEMSKQVVLKQDQILEKEEPKYEKIILDLPDNGNRSGCC